MTRPMKQNVLSTFFATDWAMEPGYLDFMSHLTLQLCLLSTEERRARLGALEAERGERLEYTYQATIRDGVAILPITGPISPYMDFFTYYSGGTALSLLARDFTAVLHDPRVDSILFKVNSPGGAVTDVSPMARMLYEARGKKPMMVHGGGQICSAAVWLGAAVGDMVIDDTTDAGSVGVYCAYLDTSKADAKNGFRYIAFRSNQSPKKNLDPGTPEGADSLQKRLDAKAQIFVEAMSLYRDVTVEKVLADFGQGDVLVGQAAVDAGLVDRIGTFEETLADMARHGSGRTTFSGAVVRGVVTAGAPATEAESASAGEGDGDCPDHVDGECPEDCPNFVPDESDEAGDQTSARERQEPPAPPAQPSEGANSMADQNNQQAPGTGTDTQADAAQTPNAADTDLRTRLETSEREIKRLTTQARDSRLSALVAGFEGGTEAHLKVLKHLAETAGEDSEVFKSYVDQQKALAEQVRAGGLYSQAGADGVPEGDTSTPAGADAKLTTLARTIAKDEGITFERAYVKACSQHPDLASVANTTVASK